MGIQSRRVMKGNSFLDWAWYGHWSWIFFWRWMINMLVTCKAPLSQWQTRIVFLLVGVRLCSLKSRPINGPEDCRFLSYFYIQYHTILCLGQRYPSLTYPDIAILGGGSQWWPQVSWRHVLSQAARRQEAGSGDVTIQTSLIWSVRICLQLFIHTPTCFCHV